MKIYVKNRKENKNRIVIYSVNYFMAKLDEFWNSKLYQLVQILSYLSSKKIVYQLNTKRIEKK